MFRKALFTLAATAAVGAALLAPTAASAGSGWHGHHRHHGWYRGVGVGFYGPGPLFPVVYDSCVMQKRWVRTPHGPRARWVRVCY
jgi:hypothetical protein